MNINTVMRVRTRTPEQVIVDNLAGKIPTPADYDVLLTGPARILKPDGQPLCVYLPGVLKPHTTDPATYAVLHSLRGLTTDNRALASGARLYTSPQNRTRARPVASAVVGAVDPMGQQRYCRLTAWTGRHLPEWELLQPLLQAVAGHLRQHVPERYANQAEHAARTDPAWIVPGTPFTTITVNNTYPTGVHTDRGDLDEGFSTIACLRRGQYTGGQLLFPAYRIAADLRDGDLILMDAHEWHGNTAITCACDLRAAGPCVACSAERISVVSYFRTAMTGCGTPEQEASKAAARAEQKSGL